MATSQPSRRECPDYPVRRASGPGLLLGHSWPSCSYSASKNFHSCGVASSAYGAFYRPWQCLQGNVHNQPAHSLVKHTARSRQSSSAQFDEAYHSRACPLRRESQDTTTTGAIRFAPQTLFRPIQPISAAVTYFEALLDALPSSRNRRELIYPVKREGNRPPCLAS